MEGGKYGRLLVIEEAGERLRGNRLWICVCECGQETRATTNSLRRGEKKSCGCLQNESRSRNGKLRIRLVEGIPTDKHPLYSTYRSMRARCYFEGHGGMLTTEGGVSQFAIDG